MAIKKGQVVAVPVSEQSEIFEKRRQRRKERISSVNAEVRAILQVRNEIAATNQGKQTFQK
ncbi:hypothetical protein KO561_07160 [Radiobacillus kanasensis]|uniref:hypothetical protein n=1 Tax=Radiobacillus kanasensis TaxID=2844358 RepID=UPI001E4B5E7D|nr:hypothetical protein [Radiobacillus kanasensis]UFU00706.1 hypothetical protein KO561_07160 [Radiobacillus kanasensis]